MVVAALPVTFSLAPLSLIFEDVGAKEVTIIIIIIVEVENRGTFEYLRDSFCTPDYLK